MRELVRLGVIADDRPRMTRAEHTCLLTCGAAEDPGLVNSARELLEAPGSRIKSVRVLDREVFPDAARAAIEQVLEVFQGGEVPTVEVLLQAVERALKDTNDPVLRSNLERLRDSLRTQPLYVLRDHVAQGERPA